MSREVKESDREARPQIAIHPVQTLVDTPVTIRHLRHPVLKQVFNYGGTTAGDAFARADSWPKVLDFLRRYLGQ